MAETSVQHNHCMFPGNYLGPTGNMQGTIKVLGINIEKVKKPNMFTEVPMPDSVMKLLNDWGKKYQKPERKESLEFRNQNKEPCVWDKDEYNNGMIVIENNPQHAGTLLEFPRIDINDTDNGPVIELPEDTDEVCVLQAGKETGISS